MSDEPETRQAALNAAADYVRQAREETENNVGQINEELAAVERRLWTLADAVGYRGDE